MLKPLLTLLCSCTFTLANSQEFSYSFSGKISLDDVMRLKDSLSQFPINTCDIKVKPEQELGYLIFSYKEIPLGDNPNIFSLTDIKRTLLEFGLIPQQCDIYLNPKMQ